MSVYSNMSKKNHNKFHKVCLHRDGAFCQRCRKSEKELKKEWKKIHPRKKRIAPYLYLHHIDGDERFPNSTDGRYCGNLQLVCASCNQLLKVQNIVQTTPREKTPEMDRGDKAKPKFLQFINNHLANYREICYMVLINRGSKSAGISQPTAKRYFDQESDFKYEIFFKQDHGVECSYSLCNDNHVCLLGEIPRKVDLIGKIIAEEPHFSRVVQTRIYDGKIIKS